MIAKIFSYSKCATCRKALNWLKEQNIEFQVIDILDNPPSKDIILEAVKQLGGVKLLLNTSGKSYREIGASKIKDLSQFEVIELLLSDPKLLKRPFFISNQNDIFVGFNQSNWEKALLNCK